MLSGAQYRTPYGTTYKKRGYAMRIVVIKSPRFLSRLLAKIFGITEKREPK
jgi:hypothetical protein